MFLKKICFDLKGWDFQYEAIISMFFEAAAPNKENVKVSSDMGSDPDPKTC